MNMRRKRTGRLLFRSIVDLVSMILVSPFVAISNLETWTKTDSSRLFNAFGQLLALLPGYSGISLRRAFYRGTIQSCGKNFHIGFGAIINKRESRIEENVSIGPYALLGSVILREGCLIGSRASVISQGELHTLDEMGRWITPQKIVPIATEVGAYCWIGEGAIIAASVGQGAMVAAGSVVASEVPSHVMMAGNPARFVKHLQVQPVPQKLHVAPQSVSK
jgi:acetyltransferase-like isoleucine patch superfamily enzyme